MKRFLLLFSVALLSVSCGMYKPVGTYRNDSPHWFTELVLNEDHSFTLNWHELMYSGTWHQVSPKEICLSIDHMPDGFMWRMAGYAITEKELRLKCKRRSIYVRLHWCDRVPDDI